MKFMVLLMGLTLMNGAYSQACDHSQDNFGYDCPPDFLAPKACEPKMMALEVLRLEIGEGGAGVCEVQLPSSSIEGKTPCSKAQIYSKNGKVWLNAPVAREGGYIYMANGCKVLQCYPVGLAEKAGE